MKKCGVESLSWNVSLCRHNFIVFPHVTYNEGREKIFSIKFFLMAWHKNKNAGRLFMSFCVWVHELFLTSVILLICEWKIFSLLDWSFWRNDIALANHWDNYIVLHLLSIKYIIRINQSVLNLKFHHSLMFSREKFNYEKKMKRNQWKKAFVRDITKI